MSLVATQVKIGRTLLSLSDLTSTNLDSDPFHFGELTGAGTQWTRVTTTGPWTDGRVLRAATRSPGAITGELYVVSAITAHPDAHDTALATLLAALYQFAWTLTIIGSDGGGTVTRSYSCEPADVTPGESHMEGDAWRWTTLGVSIPHAPVPVSGAW